MEGCQAAMEPSIFFRMEDAGFTGFASDDTVFPSG